MKIIEYGSNEDDDEEEDTIEDVVQTHVNCGIEIEESTNVQATRRLITRLPREVQNLHTLYNNIYENLDRHFMLMMYLKKNNMWN